MMDDIKVFKPLRPEHVEPEMITYVDEETGEIKYIFTNMEVARTIQSETGISRQLSKNLFKISKDIWKNSFELRRNFNEDSEMPYNIENYNFISVNNNYLISLTTSDDIEEDINKFSSKLEELCNRDDYEVIDIPYTTLNCTAIYLIKKNIRDDVKSVLGIELDFRNGLYKIYNCLEKYNRIIVDPSPLGIFNRFEAFIRYISDNFEYDLNHCNNHNETFPDRYREDELKKYKMSLREIMNIMSMGKLSTVINEENQKLLKISNVHDSQKVVDYYSKFNMPYKSLKKINNTEKSIKFRDFSLSAYDMLGTLTANIPEEENFFNLTSISRLMGIYYNICDREVVRNEMNNLNSIDI